MSGHKFLKADEMSIPLPDLEAELLRARIAKRAVRPRIDCIIWSGTAANLYGRMIVREKICSTHRAAYWATKGPIPVGMEVCHSCDNPSCVNPDHLFLGSLQDNAKDRQRKQRAAQQIGSMNGRSKLTESQVLEICAKLDGGRSKNSIAREYSVSHQAISDIANGKRWSAVTKRKRVDELENNKGDAK